MKKLFSFIFLLLVFTAGFAQRPKVKNLTTFDDKKLHFGFTIGINTLDYGIEHWTKIGLNPAFDAVDSNPGPLAMNDDEKPILSTDEVRADISQIVPGLTVSIITNLRLGRYFDLRFLPGLSFGERKLVYNVPIYDSANTAIDGASPFYSIKSTYIDLPLLFKYKSSRLNNQRPYLVAGPAFRVDISKTGKDDLVAVDRGGFYLEGGVGWDTYLRFFKLSIELKASLGIGNKLKVPDAAIDHKYYSQAIKRLTSNVFTLSFHFE